MTTQLHSDKAETSSNSRHGPSGKSPRSLRDTGEKRFATWWWFAPALAALLLIHYVPSLIGSFFAFTNWKGIGKWQFVGLDNFATIADGGPSTTALINTFIIGVSFVILTNIFAR